MTPAQNPAHARRILPQAVMSLPYSPSATAGPIALFYTYQESGAVSLEMDALATGALSDQVLTYAANAANPNFGWVSAPNTPAATSWPAQSYAVKITVTKPNSALTITQVKVYRVDANGGPTTTGLATVAALSGLNVSLGTAGTKQFVLSGSAQTANLTDRIGVKFYVHSTSASTQSFAYQAGSGTTSSFSAATPSASPAGSPSPSPSPTSTSPATPSPTPDAYARAVLSDLPVQYFKLGESSGPLALDSSLTHVNGSYTGAVQFGLTGPLLSTSSKAIGLSGGSASAGVLLPNPSAPSGTSYTIEVWAFPAIGTNYMTIWGYSSSHRLLLSSSGLLLSQLSGNFFSRNALASQKWHYLVFTYDADKQLASYYIDGALDATATVPNAAAAFTAAYYLGQYDTGTFYKWNGRLAQEAFYKKPLAGSRVFTHYTAAGYATPSPPPDAPCFGYRWSIKTGTDPGAGGIDFDEKVATTIVAYTGTAKPFADNATPRIAPLEDTVYQISNVTLTFIQKEIDRDYHLLLADAQGHTVITESPDPACATSSRFAAQIGAVRKAIDAAIPNVSATPLHPNRTVTVQGVGFFDYVPNFATGQATDGIEIHPITAICFGLNCTPAP